MHNKAEHKPITKDLTSSKRESHATTLPHSNEAKASQTFSKENTINIANKAGHKHIIKGSTLTLRDADTIASQHDSSFKPTKNINSLTTITTANDMQYQSLKLSCVVPKCKTLKKNNLYAISSNLIGPQGDNPIIGQMTSCFLTCFMTVVSYYKIPILIFGPCAEHIVSSFSCGTNNLDYQKILLTGSFNIGEYTAAIQRCSNWVMIDNIFSSSYHENLLSLAANNNTNVNIILSYPFYDDMQVQPKSIFAYVIPLISELFLENDISTIKGLTYNNSTSLVDYLLVEKPNPLKSFYHNEFEELGLSKVVLNRLKCVFGSTKSLVEYCLNNHIFTDDEVNFSSETIIRNVELLFGLAPLSLCLGKNDLLHNALQNELIFNEIKENLEPFSK